METSLISSSAASILKTASNLDLGTFNELVQIVIGLLTRSPKHLDATSSLSKLSSTSGTSISELTSIHSSLTTLITILSSQNSPPDVLQQLLEDLTLPSSHISSLSSLYTLSLPLIRSSLQNTSTFSDSRLINFGWRLDYRVRSSGAGENEPVFICCFKVVDNEGNEREEEVRLD
ncbi:hypothetical protein TL16_g09070 [Triparma laevis f. inornata]|uniref:COMM domain-containing protein n=2 Tax=Triparma laevis TaxID=1534972 RepID=A0A9W7FGV5_9STRA|nr:hypothetical protein TL16_g09070 [Triparma laevis f. inornata]GMI12114.1 hypothetical protein TrLO_g2648 [Triparma laevis f. longispina]